MIKSITIELQTSDIEIPEHLKKQPELKISIVGFTGLEAANITASVTQQLLTKITPEIQELTKYHKNT